MVLLSCQSNNERIIGHWHSVNNDVEEEYHTYDFLDSSVQFFNRNNISILKKGWYWVSEDTLEMSEACGAGLTCNFNGDTLWFHEKGRRWVRVENDRQDKFNDFFTCSRFELELETHKKTVNINLDSTIRHITIGKLKSGWINRLKKRFMKVMKDSFFVQLNYKFSNLSEINDYVDAFSEMYEPDARGFSLLLTVDKRTP